MQAASIETLQQAALDIRRQTIRCIGSLGVGHIGGSLSIVEALSVLYFDRMRVDPAQPLWPERDYFVLSKGHAGPALYATLALKGYFPLDTLDTLNRPGTILPSHCDRLRTPGVDMTAGSLGQGVGGAVGLALGFRATGRANEVFCILGDGECAEGSVWEAVMAAVHYQLDNLTLLIDRNGLQSDGPTREVLNLEPLEKRFAAFGCEVITCNGHDVAQLQAVLRLPRSPAKPRVVVMDTVKGKGFPGLEGEVACHNTDITPDMMRQALESLGEVTA